MLRATVAHVHVQQDNADDPPTIPIPEPRWCPRCCSTSGPFYYDRELELWTCSVCGSSFRITDDPRR